MFYRFVCGLFRVILFFIFRVEMRGQENVPSEGGMILAVNHRSNWDVVIVAMKCKRMLRFMAKSELFKNKLFGAIISALGAFPIHRGRGDIGAIKAALTILKEGHALLMFPEGKRLRHGDDEVHDAKAGIAMIATRAHIPVVPVYISGDYKWMSKITLVFGEPISYEEFYDKKLTMEELQNMSNDVLKKMRALRIDEAKKK